MWGEVDVQGKCGYCSILGKTGLFRAGMFPFLVGEFLEDANGACAMTVAIVVSTAEAVWGGGWLLKSIRVRSVILQ